MTSEGIRLEPGLWLNLPATTVPPGRQYRQHPVRGFQPQRQQLLCDPLDRDSPESGSDIDAVPTFLGRVYKGLSSVGSVGPSPSLRALREDRPKRCLID